MKNRVAEVNAKLREIGVEERLKTGAGYYYFYGGDTNYWPLSSVYVYRASSLTVQQWIDEYRRLKADSRKSDVEGTMHRMKKIFIGEKP